MKKSNPKEQSQKLIKVTFDLIKRNEKTNEKLKELTSGPKQVISEEIFKKYATRPAVVGFRFRSEDDFEKGKVRNDNDFDFSGLWADRKCETVLRVLTYEKPDDTLLLGIDLKRSKPSIMAEVEAFIDRHRAGDKSRLKWLKVADQCFEVWDRYERAGRQPGMITFKQIAKQLNRPLTTIKNQWRLAYEKIYHKPYEPESKYSTEEKKSDAMELVCLKCPNDYQCYKKSGEQIFCNDYYKIAGRDKREDLIEYRDDINYNEYMKHSSMKKKYVE